MSNPVIAIDLDEVLSPFVPDLMKWYNKNYQTQFQLEHFNTYDFCKIWQCSHEDSVEICNSFHTSRNIHEIQPIDKSVQALQTLKQQFDLVLVTSRPSQHLEYTHAWINLHFPQIFSEIVLCNHWTSVGPAIKKSQVCKNVNAKYFIDDLPFYAEEVAKCDIQSFLFGNYPWNQIDELHPNIQRVTDWDEILKVIKSQTP